MTIHGRTIYMGAIFWAACMVVFGYETCVSASYVVAQWTAVSVGFALCGVIWAVSGPMMMACGAVLAATAGHKVWLLFAGGAATSITGLVLAGGAWIHVIPCAGPS